MTLCAQIRMGGDAKEFQEREMNPKNATSIVWPLLRQEFIKNMRPEQYRLFITSDSEDVMTKAVKEFGDQLVTTTGFYIHLDKDRHPKHSCMIRALRLLLSEGGGGSHDGVRQPNAIQLTATTKRQQQTNKQTKVKRNRR